MTFKKNSPINFHSHLSLPIQQQAFPLLKSFSQEDWTRKQRIFCMSREGWSNINPVQLDDTISWTIAFFGIDIGPYFSFFPFRFCGEYLSAAVTVMKSMCFYYKPPNESPHADWMMIISKPVKMSQILSLFIWPKKKTVHIQVAKGFSSQF